MKMKYREGGEITDKQKLAQEKQRKARAKFEAVVSDTRRKREGTEYQQAMADKEQARKMRAKEKNKKSGLFGKGKKYNMGGEVPTYAGMPMMAEGGVVPKKKKKKVSKKKSIDGVARQGRTRGRMV